MKTYRPERIVIDPAVLEEPLTQHVRKTFSEIPQEVLEGYEWRKQDAYTDPLRPDLTFGKKVLHLKRFAGKAMKSCPGVTDGAVCCHYYTLDFVENCSFECSYCILQAFLNKPVVTVHANITEILAQVQEQVDAHPNQQFRIGTGEFSDSLAFDPILNINRQLIPFFANLPNATLELKTKSDYVDHLLDLPHRGRTIISWSVNPEHIVNTEEHKTARLQERLDAAKKAVQAGYRVAFHIDPMIYYPGWEQDYPALVKNIVKQVPSYAIAWISMGSLRYLPKLKKVADQRFPNNQVFSGEFVPSEDGKMRYLRSIRQKMFKTVNDVLQQEAPQVTSYLCMEKFSVWNSATSNAPKTNQDLENLIAQAL